MRNTAQTKESGFTLVELLVVIGILTVLLSITLVATNPQRQNQQANNTERRSDVNSILNAINHYQADNRGALPTGIDGTLRTLQSGTGAGVVDICDDLVPTYIAELPSDPETGSYTDCNDYDTQYTVQTSTGNRVTVTAPDANLSETIEVTR